MTFSIVIPVYNCADRLHVSVDSILGQSFQDFELILVNDGSKDDSLAVCEAYAEKDARVHVINQENAGSGPARNHGISQCSGEYIVFCDADDYYEPDALAHFADASGESPDLIISSYREYKYDKAGKVIPCGQCEMEARSLSDQRAVRAAYMDFRKQAVVTAPWAKAYRRELVVKNGLKFADLRRCQDVAFNLFFYEHVKKVEVIPQYTYNYQTPDDGSYLKKFPMNMFEIHKTIYQRTKESMLRWGVYNDAAKQYLDMHLQRDAVILLRLNYLNNWRLDRKQRKQYAKDILNDPILTQALSTKVSGKVNKVISSVLKTRSLLLVDMFSLFTLAYQKGTGIKKQALGS